MKPKPFCYLGYLIVPRGNRFYMHPPTTERLHRTAATAEAAIRTVDYLVARQNKREECVG